MEAAAAATLIQIVAATAAVAGTGLSIEQSIQQNRRAKAAEQQAQEKAALQQIAARADAAQQRALANRKAAQQIDAGRVLAGAAGVSGGASQMVLESAYASDARIDLANIDANAARQGYGIQSSLTSRLAELSGQHSNPFAAAFTGVAQGVGIYTNVNDGLQHLFPVRQPSNTMESAIAQMHGVPDNVSPIGQGQGGAEL